MLYRSFSPTGLLSLAYLFLLNLGALAQPTIASFTPTSGPIGTPVTITGTNFSATASNNIVYFGGVKASISAASATSLTVAVPPGASYEPISVTVAAATTVSAVPFNVTFPNGGPFVPGSFKTFDVVTAGDPQGIVHGDLDGDGKTDLVTYNRAAPGNISVFRNTSTLGAITLAARADFALQTGGPAGMVLSDLDGDGKQDVIVSINIENLSVFRNTSTSGTISFATRLDFTNVSNCSSSRTRILAADLDGNKKPDVIFICGTSVVLLRNTSTGTGSISFATPVYLVSDNTQDIVAADIDNDGKVDLAVALYDTHEMGVFRNISTVGSLSFEAKVDFAGVNNPYSLTSADFDGDGKIDVAMSNSGSSAVVFSVFRNTSTTGAISFEAKEDYATGNHSYDMAAGDIDGDGKPDLAIANGSTSQINLSRNISTTGNIAFEAKSDYIGVANQYAIALPDLDNDGKIDVTTTGAFTTNRLLIMRNKINEPVVTSFTPATAGAGATVTITGEKFNTATGVTIGGVAASSFNIVSATSIVAVVGAGAANGDVVITNSAGVGSKTGFTFVPAPTITSFLPTSGTVGTTITITGTNLTGATAGSIGGVAATSVLSVSATSVTMVLDVAASGDVSVTTPGGTGTLAGFTAVLAPTITSLTPVTGPIGTALTINGTDFIANTTDNVVTVGGIKVTPTVASTTSITVAVPAGQSASPVTVTSNKLVANSARRFGTTFSAAETELRHSSFFEQPGPVIDVNPYRIITADLNNDGKQDAITLHLGPVAVFVYPNTSTAATISFAAKIDLTTNSGPQAVEAADLDGDGKTDIVVLSSTNISTFRNTSTGGAITFDARVNHVADHGNHLRVADFDNDGRVDLVTCGFSITGIYQVSVYRNLTKPNDPITFGAKQNFAVLHNPDQVAVGDLDGDAKIDIVTASNPASRITVLQNTSTPGTISFAPKNDLLPEAQPHMVEIGDLNGDGKPEIVAGCPENKLVIFANNSLPGTIIMSTYIHIPTSGHVNSIVITQVDKDELPDIFVAGHQSRLYNVLINKSTPTFLHTFQKFDYLISGFVGRATVADLNADGRMDFLMAAGVLTDNKLIPVKNILTEPFIASFTPERAGTGQVVTITGDNFTGATAVSFGGIAAASFTVESSTVIKAVVGAGGTGAVSVTSPTGVFTAPGFAFYNGPVITKFTPLHAARGATVKISGAKFSTTAADNLVRFGAVLATVVSAVDTLLTVTVPAGATYQPVSVTTGALTAYSKVPFTPSFGGPSLTAASFADAKNFVTGSLPEGLVSGDFDNDGKPDLASVNASNSVSVLQNTSSIGNVTFATKLDMDAGGTPVAIATGDFDMDGKLDIVVANSSVNKVSVFRNASVSGSLAFQLPVDYAVSTNPYSIAVGDLNMDGRPDIVTAGYTGSGTMSVLRNTSTGSGISFAAKVDLGAGGAFPTAIAIGDLTNDQKPDLVVASSTTNNTYILTNIGKEATISFGPANPYSTPTAPGSVAIGDVNADSILDMVVGTTSNNKLRLYVFHNSGSYNTFDYSAAASPHAIVLGDMNGDGRVDVLTANDGMSVNTISVFSNTGQTSGTGYFPAKIDYTVGTRPVAVVGGDLDGDGLADMAIANNGSDNISVRLNVLPTITSFAPTIAGSGTTVVITGRNLAGASAVKFGATNAASFTVDSPTQITAVVGTGSSGSVAVTTPVTSVVKDGFVFAAAPIIHSFTPASGATATVVTINGANLSGATSVKFGATEAASFIVESAISIKATVGTGATGTVSVKTPGGTATSTATFTFVGPPVITSFTPDKGGPGIKVTITGNDFIGTTAVTFGGTAAASFIVESVTTISATLGSGASGPISVTTTIGTGTKAGFVYDPTIVGVEDEATNALTIYPNPGNGYEINLELPGAWDGKPVALQLIDVAGRRVASTEVTSRPSLVWRVGEEKPLQQGLYVLSIAVDGERVTRKVVVK